MVRFGSGRTCYGYRWLSFLVCVIKCKFVVSCLRGKTSDMLFIDTACVTLSRGAIYCFLKN